MIDERNLS